MAKKALPDPEKYFKNLTRTNNPTNTSEPEPEPKPKPKLLPETIQAPPAPAAAPVTVLDVPDVTKRVVVKTAVSSKKKADKADTDELLVFKGFYISARQFKLVAHRAVEEGVDRSLIVREAIDAYFST